MIPNGYLRRQAVKRKRVIVDAQGNKRTITSAKAIKVELFSPEELAHIEAIMVEQVDPDFIEALDEATKSKRTLADIHSELKNHISLSRKDEGTVNAKSLYDKSGKALQAVREQGLQGHWTYSKSNHLKLFRLHSELAKHAKDVKESINEAADPDGYKVTKNKERSERYNYPHHDVYHDGKHIGQINGYHAYQDKKKEGSRIVQSRKDVVRYEYELNPGHHSEKTAFQNGTHRSNQWYNRKEALGGLKRAHQRHLNKNK